MAAGVGDGPTALRAVEGTAKRFDVAGAKLTAETLQAATRNATTSGQQKAVAEAVVSTHPVPVECVGIRDTFARTAPDPESLMDAYGLAVADVVAAAMRVLARK